MKLSVVMPVYNEQATLQRVVERVMSVGLEVELLCVDDGSTDNSREILSNLQTQLPNMSDMETCYKVFRREVIQAIPLEEDRFGFEPEVTVKIARRGLRVYEVGISYWGRTYEEGKKIGWKDGVRALWCLAKYAVKDSGRALPASMQSRP